MSMSEELNQLHELHQRGVLSDEEFARAKARLIDSGGTPGHGAPSVADKLTRLRRSRNDRWLGGVCAGLARMARVEAWLMRLLFVFLFLCFGTGVLLYILLWIFLPEE